jgi:hypothetical protein
MFSGCLVRKGIVVVIVVRLSAAYCKVEMVVISVLIVVGFTILW